MGLGWGKLYVTIKRRPCFLRRKNSQSAIFTARRKNSHCVNFIRRMSNTAVPTPNASGRHSTVEHYNSITNSLRIFIIGGFGA